jgi:Protein of unknown function (DUF1643)
MTKRNNQFRQPVRPATSDRRVRLPIGRFAGKAWTVLSQCRTYRYRLVSVWDSRQPRLGVVGHSWSTANEWRSDATVRRCIGFARAWGSGGIDVGNLFGLRAAHPRKLASAADPVARTMMRTLPRCAPKTIWSCSRGGPTLVPIAHVRSLRCCGISVSPAADRWPCWAGRSTDSRGIRCMCQRIRRPNA